MTKIRINDNARDVDLSNLNNGVGLKWNAFSEVWECATSFPPDTHRHIAADLDLPFAKITHTSPVQVATGAWTLIQMSSVIAATSGMWSNTVPSRITITSPGYYIFGGGLRWAFNATGQRYIGIAKTSGGTYGSGGGILAQVAGNAMTPTNFTTDFTVDGFSYLVAGDYLELWGYQNSTVNLGPAYLANFSPTLWAIRLF